MSVEMLDNLLKKGSQKGRRLDFKREEQQERKVHEVPYTRICASLGFRMKFKTLFMSDEEKHDHHFDLQLFFNMPKQFLAPGPGFKCWMCSS